MSFGSSAFFAFAQPHCFYLEMTPDNAQLAAALMALGCPTEKAPEMAAQIDKRARQLSEQKGKTYDEALRHLLQLMQQGWAAKERGL